VGRGVRNAGILENVEFAIHNLETLLFTSISTIEYQQNIN
jgi:hypothetical protein